MDYGILQKLIDAKVPRFPRSQLFNESWMLRLLLLEFEQLSNVDLPFAAAARTNWFSEASLRSPYPKVAGSSWGEDSTNADALLGDFEIRDQTEAGIKVPKECKQLIVLEAKMGSGFSKGTTYAKENNQAARSIACMAYELASAGVEGPQLEQVGFYLLAPRDSAYRDQFQSILDPGALKTALRTRHVGCATHGTCREGFQDWWSRNEGWIEEHVLKRNVKWITWEKCIEAVQRAGGDREGLLSLFYAKCWPQQSSPAVRYEDVPGGQGAEREASPRINEQSGDQQVNYRGIITVEPGKRGGRPCIRGMRITVGDVLGWLAAGMSETEIIEDFPELTPTDIHAALAFAADRERHTVSLAAFHG